MDVGVWVEGGVVGGDYGVPDDDFGGWGVAGCGGVGRGDPEEDLFGVPVEKGGEVCVEGEGDVGVLFAFGGVVVGAAFGSGCCVSCDNRI